MKAAKCSNSALSPRISASDDSSIDYIVSLPTTCLARSGLRSVELSMKAVSIGLGLKWEPIMQEKLSFISLMALIYASPSAAQDAFADPQGAGPVINAVGWLQGTLLGTVATVVAIIAVAVVGFMMLTGRMNWRYGATVIIGCFIVFGASSIVGGIQSTAGG